MVYYSKSVGMFIAQGSVISNKVGGTSWQFTNDLTKAMQTDGYFRRRVLDSWRRSVGDPADLAVLVIK